MLRTIITNLGRFCVLSAIVIGPWTGGAYRAATLRFCLGAIFASCVFALVSLWTTPRRERRQNVYWGTIATSIPLALGLALLVFQVVPLSEATLARFSPRVAELKGYLNPPDAPELKLSDLDAPDFDAESFWTSRGTSDFASTKERLGAELSYDDSPSFDLARALAVDAAFENDFLPRDDPSRDVYGKTISVLPVASLERIVLYWGAVLAFLASSILFSTNESRRFFWRVVALDGFAFALFCLVWRANPAIRGSELLARWYGDLGDVAYGSYVNRNAAAGWLILSFAPAIGLAVAEFLKTTAALASDRARSRRDEESIAEYERIALRERTRARRRKNIRNDFDDEDDDSEERGVRRFGVPVWRRVLGEIFDIFERRFVAWALVSGAILTAIVASLSRGGASAAGAATLGVVLAFAWRRGLRRYWPALAAVGAIALLGVCLSGLYERVDERMSTLVEENADGETVLDRNWRLDNWRAATITARDYPLWGAGAGTYATANSNNDATQKFGKLCVFPENTFVQARLEGGIVGLAILIAVYAVFAGVVFYALSPGRGRETLAVGAGALALLIGQFISGLFDFGIVYLPANLYLFAALVGSCVGRRNVRFWEKINSALADKRTAAQGVRDVARATRRERVGAIAVTVLLIAGLSGAPAIWAENARCVERARLLRESKFEDDEVYFASVPTVEPEIRKLNEYLERRPDDLAIRERVIELETIRFRLGWLELLKAERSDASEKSLWESTSLQACVGRTLEFRRLGFDVAADSVMSNELVADSAPKLARALLAARRVSPLTARYHLELAQLSSLLVRAPWAFERDEIELGVRRVSATSRYHSGLLFGSAALLYDADVAPLWSVCWRRALDYSSVGSFKYFNLTTNAMATAGGEAKLTDIFDRILPDFPRAARFAAQSVVNRKAEPVFAAVKTVATARFDAVPESTRDYAYYFDRALARKSLGEYESAYEDLVAAEKLAPFEPEILRARAVLLCQRPSELGREDEALEALEKYRATAKGRGDRSYPRWLKQAVSNRDKRDARAKAQARMERERAEEEKAKKEREASGEKRSIGIERFWTSTNEPEFVPDSKPEPAAEEPETSAPSDSESTSREGEDDRETQTKTQTLK